ncbi:MAG: hypothetical protein KDE45_20570, partial [Caldilineaceae bacterium]|nr:hypothetical protein [Caldilineaceae bacterium]
PPFPSALSSRSRVGSRAWTIAVTKNKVLYPLSKPDDFVLALVEFLSDNQHRVHQLSRPF